MLCYWIFSDFFEDMSKRKLEFRFQIEFRILPISTSLLYDIGYTFDRSVSGASGFKLIL